MTSMRKRVAGIGAVVATVVARGPIASAGAAIRPGPALAQGPVSGAFQAGLDAAVGGWNAGADAAVGGWNAGAAALGLPFQFSAQASGPLGLHTAGLVPLR